MLGRSFLRDATDSPYGESCSISCCDQGYIGRVCQYKEQKQIGLQLLLCSYNSLIPHASCEQRCFPIPDSDNCWWGWYLNAM